MKFEQELQNVDWSFPSAGNKGIHSIHWYPATFISAIPGTLIPLLSKPGDMVLDPFCGSGTTGFEAIRLGRKFIGIDTNPIAKLITYSKLHFPEPRQFQKDVHSVIEYANELASKGEIPTHQQEQELIDWYHPETFFRLNCLLESIMSLSNETTIRPMLLIFSSILKSTCSQGRHWGWVCDNVKPKKHEIIYKDADSAYLNAAADYIKSSANGFKSVRINNATKTRREVRKRSKIYHSNCVNKMGTMDEGSVDLIMTSPPYYGVADYVKSQRLSYLWFDSLLLNKSKLGFAHFEALRTKETGSRSHRHRKNSFQLYLGFMDRFFSEAKRILKDGGCLALVVGESGSRQATTEALIELAAKSELDLVYRKTRDIKNSRRRLMAKVQGEEVIILKNPGQLGKNHG